MNERIALCRGTERSNCIGTALYIAHVRRKDEYVTTHKDGVNTRYDAITFLKGLKRIDNPVTGCLISWQPRLAPHKISHMGVVTSVNPLLVAHRKRTDGEFIENVSFEIINAEYQKRYPHEILYHLPKSLERQK